MCQEDRLKQLKKGWVYNMKKYAKDFLLRGLMFSGLGPIVLGIVYFVISCAQSRFSLSAGEVLLGIISTYFLAFIQAGVTVFNQIESWSVVKSLFFHFVSLYVAYVACYLVNIWIPFEPLVIIIFTVVFTVLFFGIWLIVFLTVKSTERKINEKLN